MFSNGETVLFWVGTLLFFTTYIVIAFEKFFRIDKTVAALAGAAVMLLIVLPKANADHSVQLDSFSRFVDFDVIFLLAGMMILVNYLRETGIFQYVAIKCAKWGQGRPLRVLLLLVLATAVLSAFLDNVTTVLLMAPVTLLVANELKINPTPFLLSEIIASNVGGTATLIGDPPNILIGSTASLTFVDFLKVLTPFVLVLLGLFCTILIVRFRGKWMVPTANRSRIMSLNEREALTNPVHLKKGLSVMGLTLVGFMLHGFFGWEPGVVALSGAALLLVITRADVEKALAEIEWVTLFFFVGLFIVVKGAEKVGLIQQFSIGLEHVLKTISTPETLPYLTPLLVLWITGIAAGVMNNVSFTAAALPLIKGLCSSLELTAAQTTPVWWALALGACLGGNLTPMGSAANLVVLNIAAKNRKAISFARYFRWSLPVTLASLVLATGFVLFLVWAVQSDCAWWTIPETLTPTHE